MSDPIGIIHYGLGPIGLEIARLAAERRTLRSVSAIDIDPGLVGRNLGELTGGDGPSNVIVAADVTRALATKGASVIVHCTASSLAMVMPQLLACVDAGMHVISTCEELSYPWDGQPELARRLDQAAQRSGVAVLGTGVNPGFAMDYLPVVMSGASRRVDAVTVHRVQDASSRRLPLQRKIGAGLSIAEFDERVEAGTVRHVGLPESAYAVAAALGWRLSRLDDLIEPILAALPTASGLGEIAPGRVTGLRQRAVGVLDGREVLRLTLEMAVGLSEPRDEVHLSGDPDVRLVIPGGLHGDVATAAVVVNAIEQVVAAKPGVRVMAELPPPRPR